MPLVWAGLVLIALYGLGVEPFASWSWGLVLAPFACALLWYELIEPLLSPQRGDSSGQEI
jgi:small Trp-rich protein